MLPAEIIERYCIRKGKSFKITDIDPADTCGLDINKSEAKDMLANTVKRLSGLQERLHAARRWAVLVILQGMDASGKDGAIKHVMSGVNPQGCDVHSFAAPNRQELDHDFMWRTSKVVPSRGRIGIFNRSYYEETLVVRVQPELLAPQRLPEKLVTDDIWDQRLADISNYESYLSRQGTLPIKFFLHMSKKEQLKRLLERIDDPDKRWKFDMSDVDARKRGSAYMDAYQAMIRGTATADAPWYVVPADNKWFTRLVVAATLVDRLEKLELKMPKLNTAAVRELETVRDALVNGKDKAKPAKG